MTTVPLKHNDAVDLSIINHHNDPCFWMDHTIVSSSLQEQDVSDTSNHDDDNDDDNNDDDCSEDADDDYDDDDDDDDDYEEDHSGEEEEEDEDDDANDEDDDEASADLGFYIEFETFTTSCHQKSTTQEPDADFLGSCQFFLKNGPESVADGVDTACSKTFVEIEEGDSVARAIRSGIRAASNSNCAIIGSYRSFDPVDPSTWLRDRDRKQGDKKRSSKSKGRDTDQTLSVSAPKITEEKAPKVHQTRNYNTDNFRTFDQEKHTFVNMDSNGRMEYDLRNSTRRDRLSASSYSVSTRSLGTTASYELVEEQHLNPNAADLSESRREQEDNMMQSFLEVLQDIADNRNEYEETEAPLKSPCWGATKKFGCRYSNNEQRKMPTSTTRRRCKMFADGYGSSTLTGSTCMDSTSLKALEEEKEEEDDDAVYIQFPSQWSINM